MNTVIEFIVRPMVGKVQWPGFNKHHPGSMLSLTFKLVKHTRNNNAEAIKKYLAFCIQEWPDLNDCPIDRQLLKGAVDKLR